MKEIKFRAWLWNEKEMSEVLVLDNQEEKVFVVRKDGAAGWRMFAEVELVQYTGLKDKYGVEIYEGDLVEHEDDIDGRWELYEACEIIYSTQVHGFCFRMDEGNSLSGYRNFEVVGNRYENPELLKEEPTC